MNRNTISLALAITAGALLAACSGGGTPTTPATTSPGGSTQSSTGPQLLPGTTLKAGTITGTATVQGTFPGTADYQLVSFTAPQAPVSGSSNPLQISATLTWGSTTPAATSLAIAPYECPSGGALQSNGDPAASWISLGGSPEDVTVMVPVGITSITETGIYYGANATAGAQYCFVIEAGADAPASSAMPYTVSYTITQP